MDLTNKILEKEIVVPASISEVWAAWATDEGVRAFFARDSKIELRVGGPYELYFDSDAPAGRRGSENCTILSFLPGRMLSFSWNAPPEFPTVRELHGPNGTWVVVMLSPLERDGKNSTLVTLTELGWGEGGEWDKSYDYFDEAWQTVLERLSQRFTKGPINWVTLRSDANSK